MKILNYKNSDYSEESLKEFFKTNDYLFPDPFSNYVNTDAYMEKLIKYGEILIAIHDNEMAGIACAYVNDYESFLAHLQMIFVKDKFQGLGIGRKLVYSIIELAREKGMKKVMLTVDKTNLRAEKLYKSVGYVDANLKHEKKNKKYMEYVFVKNEMCGMSLKESQARLLEMGKTIHKILEANNIPYMITFGTLLGAVRHKGFIPWDDDFDIFLFGNTYGKALEVLKEELPNDMFLENEESEPLYFHSWAHVKDLNTVAICDQFPQDNIYYHHGLSIDLYVAFEMNESEIDLWRLQENLKYQQRKQKSGLLTQSELDIIRKNINDDILIEKNKAKDSADKKAYGMVLNERIMYPEEIFPLKKYKFEDTEFYGPNDFDSLLIRFYGDYMSLPKEENRIPHYSQVERIGDKNNA